MKEQVIPSDKAAWPSHNGVFFRQRHVREDSGFTLIELIGVMVITGFLTAVIGSSLLNFTREFLVARRATRLTGEGRLAMARMTKELSEATRINYGDTTTLDFNADHEGTSRRFALWYDAANKVLNLSDARPGSVPAPTWTTPLANGVQAFAFRYYLTYDGAAKAMAISTCATPIDTNNSIQRHKYRFSNGDPCSTTTDGNDKIEVEFYESWGLSDYVVRYCDLEFPAKRHNDHWEYESRNPPGYCNTAYIYSVSMGIQCYLAVNVTDTRGCSPVKASSPPPIPSVTLVELSLTVADADGASQKFVTRVALSSLH